MRIAAIVFMLLAGSPALAGSIDVTPKQVTEWKALYGRVEAKDSIAARARIGGIVVELAVSEGDEVKAGQKIATVQDDKIAFQIDAIDAQISALKAQLDTAKDELERGKALVKQGVTTAQRVDQLKTSVDVVTNQIEAQKAQRSVLVQQGSEGDVLAPADGRVLTVPVTRNAVIMPGEPVATIGGGGFFLRLAIPERHAELLEQNAKIRISGAGEASEGTLAKIYPQLENGRVIADVDVDKLNTAFINARILVEVPVGARDAIMVPAAAIKTRSGIDFVTVEHNGEPSDVAVVVGEVTGVGKDAEVEILTGLKTGDKVILP